MSHQCTKSRLVQVRQTFLHGDMECFIVIFVFSITGFTTYNFTRSFNICGLAKADIYGSLLLTNIQLAAEFRPADTAS